METTDILDQKPSTLEVTDNAKTYLSTAASWTKFMAILNFIGIAFMVLCGLFIIIIGESLPKSPMLFDGFFIWVGLFYIVYAAILLFPAVYLFLFSQKTQQALVVNNAQVLEVSFQNMKSYWKFIGIMNIIMIVFSIIFIPIIVIASASASAAMAF